MFIPDKNNNLTEFHYTKGKKFIEDKTKWSKDNTYDWMRVIYCVIIAFGVFLFILVVIQLCPDITKPHITVSEISLFIYSQIYYS